MKPAGGSYSVFAIDPGTCESAWMIVRFPDGTPLAWGVWDNIAVRDLLRARWQTPYPKWDIVAIEHLRLYAGGHKGGGSGTYVGNSTRDTLLWIGRFIEAAHEGTPVMTVERQWEYQYLLGKPTGNDAQIRAALIDRYPATGGGRVPQVGTKKQPGPLYHVKGDLWSALAVAWTAHERQLGGAHSAKA